ncbi:MAG TPA: cation diffusion facilitator family transporter [Acidimicrobiales bacterium]|nr:cation diffusion facilitator family transporter [Acidimicrobiales bacterium]
MHEEGSRRAIIAAFLANLGIATIKFIGAAITGSAGLLAEGVHSLADTGNQGLLFLGGSRARQKATPEHPFGFGRERYFWSFVVALVLFSMGGLFAIYEGIDKLIHPHAPESLWVAVTILLLSIVLESWSLRTAKHESNPLKGRQSWWSFIRTSRNPELPVVLLEDTGALCGLFFALVGVLLAHFTDEPRWDAAGSLAIGILLVVIAMVLAVEMKGLLIGESATPEMQKAIADAMTNAPSVRRLIHLRTEHLGPDDVLVGAKLEFDPTMSVPDLADAIDDVEARVRSVVPAARVMYLEPDVHRDS